MVPGSGKITINNRSLDEYFGRETARMVVRQPFEVSLRVTTEVGVALAGELVQAILLAPLRSGVRLARGSYGYTDEAGVATVAGTSFGANQ